jgi:hypothetical protein
MAVTTLWHVSISGEGTELARIERDVDEELRLIDDFHLTTNLQYAVLQGGAPLIWDLATGRPRVTPFDVLIPSTSSNHFLGIEIDTRQLVLVDEEFQVAKRFDVRVKPNRQCDLIWSADERYAVCRRKDQYSRVWTAVRIDLKTGEVREFGGEWWAERVQFTGHGSELVQYGVRNRTGSRPAGPVEVFLGLVPDGEGPFRDLAKYERSAPPGLVVGRGGETNFPSLVASSDGGLFAVPMPRESELNPGFLVHLFDRQGNSWPWTPFDPRQEMAPGHIVAIANLGKTMVARNATQLFSVPTASIQRPASLFNE